MNAPEQLAIVACIPVQLAAIHAPDYRRIALRDDGSEYREVACPRCGELMWLGIKRQAQLVALGVPMICMVCLSHETAPDKTRSEVESIVGQLLADKIQSKA